MIVIGTRGSDLALTQSRWVAARLAARGVETRLEIIKTKGDRIQHLALDKIEGKGFFTKEIEDALLAGEVDLAVHSLKDLPGDSTPGLSIVAIPGREDVRDCLLIQPHAHDPRAAALPLRQGARVGTSAVRRKALLVHLRADLIPEDLRGNVPTRVARLREGRYDAVVLAQAGLVRLGLDLSDLIAVPLAPERFVPAPGQGALALQMRDDTAAQRALVQPLHDAQAAICVDAERTLLGMLGGGCHTPLGAHAVQVAEGVRLTAFFATAAHASARTITVTGADASSAAARAFAALRPA